MLRDGIRLLEENAIKSTLGNEHEFVGNLYLKTKLRPLEDRLESIKGEKRNEKEPEKENVTSTYSKHTYMTQEVV